MFCTNCGHTLPESGAFCTGCESSKDNGVGAVTRPAASHSDLARMKAVNKKVITITAVALLLMVMTFPLVGQLVGLPNLTTLNLWDNQTSDISPLAGLSNLTDLWLHGNPITDWSPVAHVKT